MGITEDKPLKIKNYETVKVRAGNIKHIIDREDDKTRYKSINQILAAIERPNIITVCKNNERRYFKIFQQDNEKTISRKRRKKGKPYTNPRKRNYRDNAQIESFFGYFKDEPEYKNCKTIEKLVEKIGEYTGKERYHCVQE